MHQEALHQEALHQEALQQEALHQEDHLPKQKEWHQMVQAHQEQLMWSQLQEEEGTTEQSEEACTICSLVMIVSQAKLHYQI